MKAFAISALLSLAVPLGAQEGSEDAKQLVKKAIAFYKQHGRDATSAEVTNPGGTLRKGSLYAVIYDLNGTVVAHGQLPNLVGKNLMATKDPRGKQYVQERVELAKTQGSGWHDYTFLNPTTKKWEPKRSNIEKVDDLIFASGTYRTSN